MASIVNTLTTPETVADRVEEVLKSWVIDGVTGDFTMTFEITELDGEGIPDPDNAREYDVEGNWSELNDIDPLDITQKAALEAFIKSKSTSGLD